MTDAQWFVDEEARYRRWLEDHPNGFVVNTTRKVSPSYFVLHRAACKLIGAFERYEPGAITERGYSKVVASSENDILALMSGHQISGFSKRCSRCEP